MSKLLDREKHEVTQFSDAKSISANEWLSEHLQCMEAVKRVNPSAINYMVKCGFPDMLKIIRVTIDTLELRLRIVVDQLRASLAVGVGGRRMAKPIQMHAYKTSLGSCEPSPRGYRAAWWANGLT